MNTKLREKAIKLRVVKELSYSEIKNKLGVSKSTLSYWLREYPLSEEKLLELRRKGWKKGEVSRERYRNTMKAKKEKRAAEVYKEERNKLKKMSKDSYYTAGLMLYLAEGAKKKPYSINLANTDPKVISFFIKWLRTFLDVSKDEIRIQLHLYENMDVAKEHKFWKNTLELKSSQFYKPSVRSLRKNSFSYSESYRHGTCSLYVSGVDRSTRLSMAIKALMDIASGL